MKVNKDCLDFMIPLFFTINFDSPIDFKLYFFFTVFQLSKISAITLVTTMFLLPIETMVKTAELRPEL